MTIDSMTQARLDDYVARREGVALAEDREGRTVLVCDESFVVNFIADPDRHLLHVLAQAGHIVWPEPQSPSAAPMGDEWVAASHNRDGLEWSSAFHRTSGAFVLTAGIAQLPGADEFEQWLDRFVARLRISAQALSRATHHATPSLLPLP